ncbi:hypothetical protein PtA15_4A494 [Puccinia triticina]|uniref:No apical meristem-associated C-terminal domain-containing protein n=1 Tax=Puccinia triticina TaxID=208348 RepID=A0ABY7CI66_9BASI|nr:uncharacterized protein PtA15_4A494 [Puccinia triticina]WAQ84043.1 hypothetical protein PtA15_4A494 [Puccinia triticina]WAR54882.1 hypothetical protein PtB15_4B500 [Puccinia triticina]
MSYQGLGSYPNGGNHSATFFSSAQPTREFQNHTEGQSLPFTFDRRTFNPNPYRSQCRSTDLNTNINTYNNQNTGNYQLHRGSVGIGQTNFNSSSRQDHSTPSQNNFLDPRQAPAHVEPLQVSSHRAPVPSSHPNRFGQVNFNHPTNQQDNFSHSRNDLMDPGQLSSQCHPCDRRSTQLDPCCGPLKQSEQRLGLSQYDPTNPDPFNRSSQDTSPSTPQYRHLESAVTPATRKTQNRSDVSTSNYRSVAAPRVSTLPNLQEELRRGEEQLQHERAEAVKNAAKKQARADAKKKKSQGAASNTNLLDPDVSLGLDFSQMDRNKSRLVNHEVQSELDDQGENY